MMMILLTLTDQVNGITLKGYLCDHPSQIQDYRILPFNQSACWSPKPEPREEKSYSVVQKQVFAKANWAKCSKTVSSFTFVCTHNMIAAHQRLAEVPQIEIPVKVGQEECHTWITTGRYKGPNGRAYSVEMGRTTVLNFYQHGHAEISGESIICEGERLKLGDRIIEGVAVLQQVKVTLEPRKYRFAAASGKVQVQKDHVELPCVGILHYCETSEATFIWDAIESSQYQLVQIIQAELREEEGAPVLISRQHRIRLVLGDQQKQEGRVYFATKYDQIFVCEGAADYLTPISSNVLRLTAYVNARDDFLSWALEEKIKEAYEVLSNQRCHREQDMLKTTMATSFTSPEGYHHLHLGENRFGALIGEVLYEYTCTEVQVSARPTKRCTQELPVTWKQNNLYLEPISRLLKTYGNTVPCSHLLETKFLTTDGRWISSNPELKYTKAPHQYLHFDKGLNWSHLDMAEGGLYTPTQLKEFQQLLNYPRAKKIISDHLVHEVCSNNDHTLCADFNHMVEKTPGAGLIESLQNRLLKFFHNFGDLCAIFIAIYVFGTAILWITGFFWSCAALKEVKGRRRWIQPFLPIKWVASYDYGRTARRNNQDFERINHGVAMNEIRSRNEEDDRKLLHDLETDKPFE